jgi:DNA-binding NarL/FixJ family response regulator
MPGTQTVGHADGVQEALAGIQAAGPDVVVLDLHLKDGNGLSVLKALQQSAPQIAVFVLTNYPEESYRRMAERYGARGFFDKSHDIGQLRDALAAFAK